MARVKGGRPRKPLGSVPVSSPVRPQGRAAQLLDQALHGEPVERLRAARQLSGVVERLERDAWSACRDEGLSWAQLAVATGLTRSGAQSRAGKLAAANFRGVRTPAARRPTGPI